MGYTVGTGVAAAQKIVKSPTAFLPRLPPFGLALSLLCDWTILFAITQLYKGLWPVLCMFDVYNIWRELLLFIYDCRLLKRFADVEDVRGIQMDSKRIHILDPYLGSISPQSTLGPARDRGFNDDCVVKYERVRFVIPNRFHHHWYHYIMIHLHGLSGDHVILWISCPSLVHP